MTSGSASKLAGRMTRNKKSSHVYKNRDNGNDEIVEYMINPILIKPLIIEQVIVKSKNTPKS